MRCHCGSPRRPVNFIRALARAGERSAGKATELQPKYPPDLAGGLRCPVPGLYGGKDAGIPAKDVEAMREALKKAEKPCEVVVYPEAPHAFFADYRPSYRREAAEDGWKRMLAWLKKNGVA